MAESLAPLVVIVGETASGKTDLALKLAQRYRGEVIAADSRTIYKGMDIGTAKPSKKEQTQTPHYLLDIIEPDQRYSAAQFKEAATAAINDIWWHGRLPIMVGGSGMYVDSVIFDYQFTERDGERDPENPRHLLKKDTNVSLTNSQQLRPNTLVIGLKIEKSMLEQRINARVEQMVENGLVEEAKKLGKKYGWDNPALKGCGYQYIEKYLAGEASLEEIKTLLARSHRNLAKKQRTWFKRNKYIHWIDGPEQAESLVQTFLTRFEY